MEAPKTTTKTMIPIPIRSKMLLLLMLLLLMLMMMMMMMLMMMLMRLIERAAVGVASMRPCPWQQACPPHLQEVQVPPG